MRHINLEFLESTKLYYLQFKIIYITKESCRRRIYLFFLSNCPRFIWDIFWYVVYFHRKLFKLVKMSNSASYDDTHDFKSGDDSYNMISQLSMRVPRAPKIVATCYCARKPGYYLFNAYFLIFLITVSALTIFSVDCKLPQNRLQINVTLLLTSVSFKWVKMST